MPTAAPRGHYRGYLRADIPRVNNSCVFEFSFSSAFVVRYAVFDSVICQRRYIDPNTSFVTLYSTWSSVTSLHRSQHVAPTLFVTMSGVFLKSTMRPLESVRRPSSRISSIMLNTSGWAFSISSNRTTDAERRPLQKRFSANAGTDVSDQVLRDTVPS